jgi:hypothetical protein
VFKGSQKGQTLSLEMKQYMLEEITARGAFSETAISSFIINNRSAQFSTPPAFFSVSIRRCSSSVCNSNTALSSVFKGSQKGQTLSLEMKQYMLEEITARASAISSFIINNRSAQFSTPPAFFSVSIRRCSSSELLHLLMETEKKAGGVENWALRLLIMKLDIAEEKKVSEASLPSPSKSKPCQ